MLFQTEIKKAQELLDQLRSTSFFIQLIDDENYIFPNSLCKAYRHIRLDERLNIWSRDSSSSTSSPIHLAYSILVYDKVEQFERLLMSMYEPTNIYCIHVDAKSTDTVRRAIRSIVDCFDNVFIATKLESIVYAGFSRLKADINCMNDLLDLNRLVGTHENLIDKRVINWRFYNFFLIIIKLN